MEQHDQDKQIERERYDERAKLVLDQAALDSLGPAGAQGIPIHLRAPYLAYEKSIRMLVSPGASVLEVCCGNGLHSLTAPRAGGEVSVSDIAPGNVDLTLQRAKQAGFQLKGKVADAENLPWPDESFDVITCAGSLSYVDHATFFTEITRLLRPGGSFVCVDSLNHNPIYRFNRFTHYLRGNRSKSTLERMPRKTTLDLMGSMIGPTQTSFHGILSFLSPLMIRLLGRDRWAQWSDGFDQKFPSLRGMAFKFVAVARNPSK